MNKLQLAVLKGVRRFKAANQYMCTNLHLRHNKHTCRSTNKRKKNTVTVTFPGKMRMVSFVSTRKQPCTAGIDVLVTWKREETGRTVSSAAGRQGVGGRKVGGLNK